MASIFDKAHDITPSRLAAVAERRFGDATALCDTGENARANGAQYLCGLVIEILLKAQLVRQYPEIARKRSHDKMVREDRAIWNLIWRSHDLEMMIERLPHLAAALALAAQRERKPYDHYLSSLCATWSIHARYSRATSTIQEARKMLDRVRYLKELLK